MGVTIGDVAGLAGVGHGTVSRVVAPLAVQRHDVRGFLAGAAKG